MFSKKFLLLPFLFAFFVFLPTLQTVQADSLSISATVPADPNSYSAILSNSTSGTTFPENKELDYTIVYGTTLTDPNPLTVQASWTQGTISGDTDPSIDVLQYITNSATEAYGATHPVIDPINRTITWTINNFPGNTQNQVVHFSLITTNNYTAKTPVNFSVSGRVIGIGTQTPDSTLSATYTFAPPAIQPTPTQSAPTASNQTPSPALPASFTLQQISMQTISQNRANIFVATSLPSQITILYGTSIKDLSKKITDVTMLRNHSLQLDNLHPQTHYYFQIVATGSNAQVRRSDMYTFSTAHTGQILTIDQNSLTLIDNNVIVFDQGIRNKMNNSIAIVPQKTSFNFSFTVPNPSDIVSIQAFLRDAGVLGVSTFVPEVDAASQLIPLAEVESGIYNGSLLANQPTGKYFLVARIIDKKGNLSEQNLINLHVIQPLLVQTEKTKTPIEHAQVTLYYQSVHLQQFNLLLPDQISISNPAYSNNQGEVILPLPQGVYKAHVSAPDYQDQDVIFTIGTTSKGGYPTVTMKQLPFNLLTFVSSLGTTALDALLPIKVLVQNATYSHRFLTLFATILISLLVLLTAFAFHFKHGLPLYLFPFYLLYHIRQAFSAAKKNNLCKGIVVDDLHQDVLAGVQIYLADSKQKHPTIFATTNRLGEFQFPLTQTQKIYKLGLRKHGYQTTVITENVDEALRVPLQLRMQKNQVPSHFLDYTKWVAVDLLESLFTTLLLLSFFFEVLLGYIFGWESAVVFLAISIANLLLWLKHVYHVYK